MTGKSRSILILVLVQTMVLGRQLLLTSKNKLAIEAATRLRVLVGLNRRFLRHNKQVDVRLTADARW